MNPGDIDAGSPPAGVGGLADALVAWQAHAGRHDLPWQRTRDPYRIWVSEIMLQQTQVATVIGYYQRFLQSFPDVETLARADRDEVLRHWSGLGYYSRARNLHVCAQAVVARHGGAFPADPDDLEALPGIGRSTAAAIAAFAWGMRVPILDGNVKRVLCRVFAVEGFPGERAVEQGLWSIAARELPAAGDGRIEAYTQGLMDLGATVCMRVRPRCDACPLLQRCQAHRLGRVDALPTPRAPRRVETRDAELLLLRSGDAVLLERRPGKGLWGGLWSLPEFAAPTRGPRPMPADAGTLMAWAGTRYRLPIGEPTLLSEFRHAFTHFRLHARVWQAEVGIGLPAPEGHEWLALANAAGAPLPRPIKTLLESLPMRMR